MKCANILRVCCCHVFLLWKQHLLYGKSKREVHQWNQYCFRARLHYYFCDLVRNLWLSPCHQLLMVCFPPPVYPKTSSQAVRLIDVQHLLNRPNLKFKIIIFEISIYHSVCTDYILYGLWCTDDQWSIVSLHKNHTNLKLTGKV